MNVWDSELLIQKKSAGIVTDNLLVNFDAQDFGVYPDSFTDPVTGKTIIPYIRSTAIFSMTKDGNVLSVDCIKKSTGQTYINMSSFELLENVSCVDFTFRCATGTMIDGKLRFGEYVSTVLDCGTNNAWLTFDGTMHHYTIYTGSQGIYRYIDGVGERMSNAKTPYDTNTFVTIYGAYREIQHLFDIGSIRVYSAPLTDEQIMINHEYEKSVGRITA